jgi:hypothetical protein
MKDNAKTRNNLTPTPLPEGDTFILHSSACPKNGNKSWPGSIAGLTRI